MGESYLNNNIGYVSGEQEFNPQTKELRQRLIHKEWELYHNQEIKTTLADIDMVMNRSMKANKKLYEEIS